MYSSTGGVCFGFNETVVRLWAPSQDPRPGAAAGPSTGVIFVGDGWGGEVNSQLVAAGMVKVQVWATLTTPIDFADITVTIGNVNEAPAVSDAAVTILQSTAVGTSSEDTSLDYPRALRWVLSCVACAGAVVYHLSAGDEDSGTVLQYAIIAGDPDGAFAVDTTSGVVTVSANAPASFLVNPSYLLFVQVSDGLLTDVATVAVTISNVNHPPVIQGATFFISEVRRSRRYGNSVLFYRCLVMNGVSHLSLLFPGLAHQHPGRCRAECKVCRG